MKKTTKQLAKAAAIGVAAGGIDFLAVTTNLHRSYTHKSFEMNKTLDTAARVVIWGTGTRRRTWAAIHRLHHEEADTPEDPHSPVQLGKWGVHKLFMTNTPDYFRKSKEVDAANEYPPDLQPDKLDEVLFDKKKLGLAASLAGHAAVNKLAGNPGYYGAVSWAVEKLMYTKGGDGINAGGHSGKNLRKALTTGVIEPHPDGSYGSDSAVLALLTFGEGRQKSHHDHPERVFFGDDPEEMSLYARAAHDLGGTIVMGLIEQGLAAKGTAPPSPESDLAPVIPLFRDTA